MYQDENNMVNINTSRMEQRQRRALADVTSQKVNRLHQSKTIKNIPAYLSKYENEDEVPTGRIPEHIVDEVERIEEEEEFEEEEEGGEEDDMGIEVDDISDLETRNRNSLRDQLDELEQDYENFVEPLSPIFNEEIQDLLDQAFKMYYRSTPDPEDDDTYDSVMVVEYSTEIFRYMRKLELKYRPNPYYMAGQPELKWEYRKTVIDWIVQVHERFQLLPETLYLTVNIIDRFLSRKTITLNRFQLVSATALLIASKYEEINCPTIKDIVYMVDDTYSREDIIEAEKYMIDALAFEVSWPGPMSFLRRISKADDYEYSIRNLAKYLLETTIMEPSLISALPSWLAAGAYFLSRIILGFESWTMKHVYYSGYTQEQLYPLASLILENCQNYEQSHQAIWAKYGQSQYHQVALIVTKFLGNLSSEEYEEVV
ncbi:G2/mitotic-specific cyclin-4 [Nakaseomyces bracarensis]|uniref:G2/mitotic-specific cyclin-4 n=1 Tax=Nakaseomyces bracarensis TaxID=273131 RepID=A0ABR4NPX7_9SACH